MKTVTIHQPVFFPWFPFFQKIQKADSFVFLRYCQYEKNGYQNRFNIGSQWFNSPARDWTKIKKSLNHKYGQILSEFDTCISQSLCETNINIIIKICNILNINTDFCYDNNTDKKSTHRLAQICKDNNATHYLSGTGGKKYLQEQEFMNAGIDVIYQIKDEMTKKPILEILKETY